VYPEDAADAPVAEGAAIANAVATVELSRTVVGARFIGDSFPLAVLDRCGLADSVLRVMLSGERCPGWLSPGTVGGPVLS